MARAALAAAEANALVDIAATQVEDMKEDKEYRADFF